MQSAGARLCSATRDLNRVDCVRGACTRLVPVFVRLRAGSHTDTTAGPLMWEMFAAVSSSISLGFEWSKSRIAVGATAHAPAQGFV
jgi:hypothetical protein